MPLRNVPRPGPLGPVPADIKAFLHEADRRIRRFHRRNRSPAFVACNFAGAYGILEHLAAQAEAAGTLFCEWGSGFGVVACLAALLEFDACGIEVDGRLGDPGWSGATRVEKRRLPADVGAPTTANANVRKAYGVLRSFNL